MTTVRSPLVVMEGIVKNFGAIEALRGVDIAVDKGEVVALLGDNGAGKSTLIKILSGVTRPSAGRITVRGRVVSFASTKQAIAAGIETIHQGGGLVEQLDIERNLFLGREPKRRLGGVIPQLDKGRMQRDCATLLRRVGLQERLDGGMRVANLSGGQRQAISIARAMYFEADLILLDEPTNNLGLEETRSVLRFLAEAKDAGRSSILITHNIGHVFQVADRIVILRQGRKVKDIGLSSTTVQEVERIITGE